MQTGSPYPLPSMVSSVTKTTADTSSYLLPESQEAAARSLETFLPKQLSEGNH